MRRFLLFYIGDDAAVLYNSRELDSVYLKVQGSIYEAAAQAFEQLEISDCPVAQSLGCQVISNYLWDAQHELSIWAPRHAETRGAQLPDGNPFFKDPFLKLATTQYLLTTGCNIPLIVSGLADVVPIDRPNDRFYWLNFYDPDDAPGWPPQRFI